MNRIIKLLFVLIPFSLFAKMAWLESERMLYDWTDQIVGDSISVEEIRNYYRDSFGLDVFVGTTEMQYEFYSIPFIRTFRNGDGEKLCSGPVKPCVHYIERPLEHFPRIVESTVKTLNNNPFDSLVSTVANPYDDSLVVAVLGVSMGSPGNSKSVVQSIRVLDSLGISTVVVAFDIPRSMSQQRIQIFKKRAKRAEEDGYPWDYYFLRALSKYDKSGKDEME